VKIFLFFLKLISSDVITILELVSVNSI